MPAMDESKKVRLVSISMPPQLLRELQEVAGDRLKRGERGGVSGTVREMVVAGLAQLRQRSAR